MANTIKLKRSSVPGKIPAVGDLELGELGLNTYDGKLYTKKNVSGTESIVDLSGSAGIQYTFSSTAPASPNPGDEWTDADTGVSYKYLDDGSSSQWVEIWGLGAVESSGDITVNRLVEGTARQLIQTNAAGDGVEWTSNIDVPGTLDVTGTATFDGAVVLNSTGYIDLPVGTTAERPGAANSGMLRFNSDLVQFEGYDGTAWGAIGGGGGFEIATTPPASPTAGDTYWDQDEGNAYIYYDDGTSSQWVPLVPSTPPKNATGGGTDEVFFENMQTVSTDYTLTTGRNAMSAGPITIDAGVSVTVPSGQSWVIV